MKRRLDTQFRTCVKHVWVDEFGTTKFDCVTFEELGPAYRWGKGKGGREGWIRDHDVKFRKTKHQLESWHPCPVPERDLVGRGFRAEDLAAWLPVDRDGNAAYAIQRLCGVAEEDREGVYRRASQHI